MRFHTSWLWLSRFLSDNYKSVLAATLTFAAGSFAAVLSSSILPAIAAASGAVAGIITAYTTHKASGLTAQNNLMSQYLGFISSLQMEVNRLRLENNDQRQRIEQLEKDLSELKGRAA